ncbi:IDEAL domain-containing protein [Aneurinibacillus sp. Ricciae_BoGa-3]|uniref:IDEAL domain-containing protein n=1 Tax=Aneurinibacillus sp. Ricciae_BoGa-3 TaxID=3022697 RepID=UPI002340330D|nr:IDEAL domain-containing protein [Aneurinibacillus sp. Ricciae_BoGa-3]WCK56658.1 IDEAL domain-containing protein [Aneurinibacillus sp. Ricciae_BoGa-3]
MKVGDWVHTIHEKHKITGFITETNDKMVRIFVTIPKNYGVLVVNRNLILKPSLLIHPKDLPSLIDFSLDTNDREWFYRLVRELKLWNTPGITKGVLWSDD